MIATGANAAKTRVFISYSRKDMAFADRLETTLKGHGFKVLIDREEIYAFEDWWKRIQALISRADTIVFVLSPDSAKSDVALKELEYAASLNKRFAPIVCRAVDDRLVPEPLRRLNFIFFHDASRYEFNADQLAQALQTDIDWIRKHTEYGEAARRWSTFHHPSGLLLRSPALEEAELWIASRPVNAPLPTDETRAFVTDSRRWATQRRNILTASLSVAVVVALALAGLAYWERSVAVAQRDVAQTRRIATLAALTNSEMMRGNSDEALRLGVHAARLDLHLDHNTNGDSVARAALVNAVVQSKWQIALRDGKSPIFRPDGLQLLTDSYNQTTKTWVTQVWDIATGQKVTEWSGQLLSTRFSRDGKRIVELVERQFARVLDAATGASIANLRGHTGDLNSARFSPDGSRVVTASQDKTARIWDVASGSLIFVLQGHDGPVNSAVFSHDGSRIVTASSDNTARVWDAKTGKLLVVLSGHEDKVVSALFNSDGSRVVTSSYDQTARLWDSSTGAQLQTLRGHTFVLNSADFNLDGSRVLTTSWDNTARLWNAETGAQITSVYSSGLSEFGLASANFSPSGSQVAIGSGTILRILDATNGKELLALNGHEQPIGFAVFSPDGSQVVTESLDNTVRIWNLIKAPEVMTLRGSETLFSSVEVSPHGTHVIATLHDGTLRVWGTKAGKELLKWDAYLISSAHFSPDGSQFIVVYSGIAEVFDAETLKSVMKINRRDIDVWIDDAQFSHNGQQIVTISSKISGISRSDYNSTIWDLKTGKEIATLRGHSDQILTADFSPDDSLIVTASQDKTARVWNVETGTQISVLAGHTDWVTAAFFSPDGARVFTHSHDHTTRIWSSTSGIQISLLQGTIFDDHPSSHPQLASDGSRIITVSGKVATIWDTTNGKELAVLRGHTEEAIFAAFSPDGSRVVSASTDKTARIWNAETGEQIAVLRGHEGRVEKAVFGANGSQILTASDDHSLRLWDVGFATMATEDLVTRVCTLLLGGHTGFSADEMELAGYRGGHPIDVCTGQ